MSADELNEQPIMHFEAQEDDPLATDWGDEFGPYEKLPVQVLAWKVPVPWSCITVDGNFVTAPAGSYCVIDQKGFPYPCDSEIFEGGHKAV